jgi:NitT/TauT family transport system ATP-binding protein
MPSPAIEFQDVRLQLGGTSIYEKLSFDVRLGEFVCLLGPSGCGKSTALRLIGGLMPAQGGAVTVDGRTPPETWERLAYVFQSPRLLPWKDALDNAAFGLEMRNPDMSVAERRDRAARQLARVGLSADRHKMPAMLSGGERQRVSIARAMALDPNTRMRLRNQLVELWQGSGKTIVFVTHDVDEALFLAERIIVLSMKPACVVQTAIVDAPRPRLIESDPELRRMRRGMLELFAAIEKTHVEEKT